MSFHLSNFMLCNLTINADFLDLNTLKQLNLILLVYAAFPIVVVCIITSTLTLFILQRLEETFATTRFILFCIVSSDLGFLIFNFVTGILITIDIYNVAVLNIIFCIRKWFEFSRNWFIATLAFDRFIKFYYPLHFQVHFTFFRVRLAGIVQFVFGSFLQIPNMVYITTYLNGKNCAILRETRLVQCMLNLTALTMAPFLLMMVFSMLTTSILVNIFQRAGFLKNPSLPSTVACSDDRSNHVLGIINKSLVVFFTTIPSVPMEAMLFYQVYKGKVDKDLFTLLTVLCTIATFFSIVNSTSNFFICIHHNRRYRRILVKLLLPKRFISFLKE